MARDPSSLRMTLIRTISGVLLFTLLLSAVLTYWHATSKVDTEVGAAIEMAEKTVRKAIQEIAHDDDPRLELVRLVHVFDGNRHVKASFIEPEPTGTAHLEHGRAGRRAAGMVLQSLRSAAAASFASSFRMRCVLAALSSSRRRFAARWRRCGTMWS